jgi:hypothetical protein
MIPNLSLDKTDLDRDLGRSVFWELAEEKIMVTLQT